MILLENTVICANVEILNNSMARNNTGIRPKANSLSLNNVFVICEIYIQEDLYCKFYFDIKIDGLMSK